MSEARIRKLIRKVLSENEGASDLEGPEDSGLSATDPGQWLHNLGPNWQEIVESSDFSGIPAGVQTLDPSTAGKYYVAPLFGGGENYSKFAVEMKQGSGSVSAADRAEYVVAAAFAGSLPGGNPSYDVVLGDGTRVEVKLIRDFVAPKNGFAGLDPENPDLPARARTKSGKFKSPKSPGDARLGKGGVSISEDQRRVLSGFANEAKKAAN